MWATYIFLFFFHGPKVGNHLSGEKSPNLVTRFAYKKIWGVSRKVWAFENSLGPREKFGL
jgi:hypothetical protein